MAILQKKKYYINKCEFRLKIECCDYFDIDFTQLLSCSRQRQQQQNKITAPHK